MARESYFGPELFRFLTQLAQHNDRDWFQANKSRYETLVRDRFLHFLEDLAPRVRTISPRFRVDPRPTGGSMMRIYRDTRFSKDKTPYKTAVAAHFAHADGTEGGSPGFYLHLQPGECIGGAGIWRPEPRALKSIRDAIVAKPKVWAKVTHGVKPGSACSFHGESLKRAPQGYDPEHPYVEDLKRKDFALSAKIPDSKISGPAALDAVVDAFTRAAPFARFVTEAVGLKF